MFPTSDMYFRFTPNQASTMAQNTPGPPPDLGLFDTFNTQDVSTAPTSEREDPLTLDDIGDFLNSEIDIKEEAPYVSMNASTSKEEAPVGSIGESSDMVDPSAQVVIPQLVDVKTESEELIEEVMQLDSDGAPIVQNPFVEQQEQPNAGVLRIRSFAMDPDSLCVLPSHPPATATSHIMENTSDFAPSDNIQTSSDNVLTTHDYAMANTSTANWQSSGLQVNPATSDASISMMMHNQPPPNVVMAQSEFYPGDLDNEVDGVNTLANNQPNMAAGTALSFPYISMQVLFSI